MRGRIARLSACLAKFVVLGGLLDVRPVMASPVGLWRAPDGAIIRVAPCGPSLCAFIAKPAHAIDPDTGRPPTDKHNHDPAKRNRPLEGVQVLSDMHIAARGKWSGSLYNDDDGNTYNGNLIELDAERIRIEGCVLGICGGDTLTRVR
ncbi:MAG TPA: DUF2147 domain-containing protein [Pseudolabrys sp.]|nr:DUF2147 domain-containing protein [Pseudolabrys sp.]